MTHAFLSEWRIKTVTFNPLPYVEETGGLVDPRLFVEWRIRHMFDPHLSVGRKGGIFDLRLILKGAEDYL